ncbi:MAG: hypothetical protein ABJF23_17845 [Bryobacteraceae bacterium]
MFLDSLRAGLDRSGFASRENGNPRRAAQGAKREEGTQALWITVAVVAVVVVIAGSLVYTRFHNEGAI